MQVGGAGVLGQPFGNGSVAVAGGLIGSFTISFDIDLLFDSGVCCKKLLHFPALTATTNFCM